MKRSITEELLEQYRISLYNVEKSPLTIKKYIRDVRKLMEYAAEAQNNFIITKELVIAFKDKLYNQDHYKIESVNSILEAVNRFFDYMEWYELGHSNIETTRRYVRETSREHQKLLEKLHLVGVYW